MDGDVNMQCVIDLSNTCSYFSTVARTLCDTGIENLGLVCNEGLSNFVITIVFS